MAAAATQMTAISAFSDISDTSRLVWIEIAKKLPIEGIAALAECSKFHRNIAYDNSVWIARYSEKFGLDIPIPLRGVIESVRTLYIHFLQLQSVQERNCINKLALMEDLEATQDPWDLGAFLRSGGDLNVFDANGVTLLFKAVRSTEIARTKALIKAGADVSLASKRGKNKTPLHAACKQGNAELSGLLLEAGASVEARTIEGATPLHMAAKAGAPETLVMLLKTGIELNVKDLYGRTPLHFATCSKNPELVRLLLESRASAHAKDDDDETPLHYAADADNPEAIRLLLGARADIQAIDKKGETPLHAAARNGSLDALRLLMGMGADKETKSQLELTPLALAIIHEEFATVQELILRGVELETSFKFPVMVSEKFSVQGTMILNPLLLAMSNDSVIVLRALLEAGADRSAAMTFDGVVTPEIDEINSDSIALLDALPPLQLAIATDNEESFDLLLEFDANINSKTPKGWTPLHCAVFCDNKSFLSKLLERGADRTIPDNTEKTPLMYARERDNAELIELLS